MNNKMKTNYKTLFTIPYVIAFFALFMNACNNSVEKKTKSAEVIVESKEKPKTDTAAKPNGKKQIPLTLTIKNLESSSAQVVVTFYNTKSTFLNPPKAVKRYRFTPAGNILTAKIDDLKYGEYAFVTFQDMDGNGEFEKNKIGIPKEPYGFSNDFKPTVRAPEFSNCRFLYSKSKNTMAVSMMSK